jgi:predicted kinase
MDGKSTLILLVGPPGSGKSTLAKKYIEKNFIYINQDSQGQFHKILFEEAMKSGKNVIVDRMNFDAIQRIRYLSLAKKLGNYHTKIIVLHESYNTCMERMLTRVNHETIKDYTSAKSALDMFFNRYERVEDWEADEVERIWPNNEKIKAACFDLDGTICNIDHRLHYVQNGNKRWDKFFEEIPEDSVNEWCRDILYGVSNLYSIVLCSGRHDTYREVTKQWLQKNKITHDDLFMRHNKDSRRDDIIKEIILDFEILTRYEPVFFIDDRKRVCDMWRRRGFTCLQCSEGNF